VVVPGAVTQVALGDQHSCVLTEAQQVYCFGNHADLALGNSAAAAPSAAPLIVETSLGVPLGGATHLASGDRFSCAATASAGVYCWGTLPGSTTLNATVVPGTSGFNDVQELVAGLGFACVRRAAFGGSIHCWGDNGVGQIAAPAGGIRSTAALVGGVSAPAQLYAGRELLCARTGTGVRCRGNNNAGRLGTLDTAPTVDRFSPVASPVALTWLADGGGGAAGICAFDANAHLYCWGDNASGWAGLALPDPAGTPTRVENLTRFKP